jgi:hypothetical protein
MWPDTEEWWADERTQLWSFMTSMISVNDIVYMCNGVCKELKFVGG